MWMDHQSQTLSTERNIRSFRCYYPGFHPVSHSPLSRCPNLGWWEMFLHFASWQKNVFTLQTATDYTAFAKYCDTVGYIPYLHNDKPDCIPVNLTFFSHSVVTHIESILLRQVMSCPMLGLGLGLVLGLGLRPALSNNFKFSGFGHTARLW